MKWIDRLNRLEVFLGLPISEAISEANALQKLKHLRRKYNIIA